MNCCSLSKQNTLTNILYYFQTSNTQKKTEPLVDLNPQLFEHQVDALSTGQLTCYKPLLLG